jgi:sigma-B regulation protein RsbU (phosphoserine phosphatase)
VIDPRTLRLTYCSAGHEPPLVVRPPKNRPAGAGDIAELSVGGMIVGIDPAQTYQRAVYDLRPGDFIIAYTDGLVDAVNFAGQRFGKQRVRTAILNAVREIPNCTAIQMVDRILWEVRQFAGLAPRPDDLTLITVRVN